MADGEQRKLAPMLDRMVDGSCSDESREVFSCYLDENPQLQDAVVRQMAVLSLLQWSLSPTLSPSLESSPTTSFGGSSEPASTATRTAPPKRWGRWMLAAGVAASLLLASFVWLTTNGQLEGVGAYSTSADAQLGTKSSALAKDHSVVPGTLSVQSGQLVIEFVNGVEMKVNGPAECVIHSDLFVELNRGQATADVPRWARGFTIATPDIEIVDLGTRFGVSKLVDVRTDVVVFEGEVDLKSLQSTAQTFQRRLTQGEAARISQLGGIERIFQVHGDAYDNEWSTLARLDQNGVIARVWDNLNGDEGTRYYQVISTGFGEDVPAYVDHPHEWNSLSAAGLPAFLQQADYVRTVNDYRYMGYLAIQVEMAASANLYVFFDTRVLVPEWLSSGFVNTGMEVGLDEDAWGGNPTFSLDGGAGHSIDNVFTVWCRPCEAGEVVVLGSMGVGSEARAMYGIAATRR